MKKELESFDEVIIEVVYLVTDDVLTTSNMLEPDI